MKTAIDAEALWAAQGDDLLRYLGGLLIEIRGELREINDRVTALSALHAEIKYRNPAGP